MTPSDRGVSPVVGVVLVVAVTVALAGTAGVAVMSAADLPADPPRARFDLRASADGRVTVVHRGGDALDVGSVRVRIAVDGEALAHQPPVPFFAARGFRAGPTGPFNRRTDGPWSAGERASVRVASTNHPAIRAGSRVEVELYADGALVWRETTVARGNYSASVGTASAAAPASASASSSAGARATVVIATVGS